MTIRQAHALAANQIGPDVICETVRRGRVYTKRVEIICAVWEFPGSMDWREIVRLIRVNGAPRYRT